MRELFAPALFQAILIGMAIGMIGRHSKFSKAITALTVAIHKKR
jgi:hypothetical protein